MPTMEAATRAESGLSVHLEGSRRLLMLKEEDRWTVGGSFTSSMPGGAAAVKARNKSNKNKVNSERVHLRCERDGKRREEGEEGEEGEDEGRMDGERARAQREREKLVIKEVPARHQGEELQLGDFVNRSSLCRYSNTRTSHAPFCPCARSSATRADVQNLVRKRSSPCCPSHFNSLFVRRQTVCACPRVTVRV